MTYRLDADVVYPYGSFEKLEKKRNYFRLDFSKVKRCCRESQFRHLGHEKLVFASCSMAGQQL